MTKPYRVITTYHCKGGVGKTTTDMYLGEVLAATPGENVELVDADPGAQTLASHAIMLNTDYPDYQRRWHVSQWLPKYGLLPDFIDDRYRQTGATLFMIDTSPDEADARAAVEMADLLIVPCTPSQYDLENLARTYTLCTKPLQRGVPARILLTRVNRAGGGDAAIVRAKLVDAGYELFATDIPRDGQLYAKRFGKPIEDTGAYADVAKEIQSMGVLL